MTPKNRQPFYPYPYVIPVGRSMSPLEIGLSLLAFPFVFTAFSLYEAGRMFAAWGKGVRSGLGLGADAQPVTVRPPVERWDGKREPAYVQYLFGPVWRDIKHTVAVAREAARKAVTARFKLVQTRYFVPSDDRPDEPLGNRFVGVGRYAALAFAAVLAAALLTVLFAVQAVAIVVLWLIGIAAIYLLRGADSLLLLGRGIRITCPNPDCYRRVPYPTYQCDKCRTMQHDVRPGRYGMLHRYCKCGNRMPTLLMLGSHRLKGFCPYCDKELEQSAGRAPEIVLPVFGSPGAGKTQFLGAVAMASETLTGRSGGSARPADDYTGKWYHQTTDAFTRGSAMTKTATVAQHAYSMRLEVGGKARTLKMFDAAGEIFKSSSLIREMGYLQARATYVMVIDPLSLPRLWDSLDAARQKELKPIRAEAPPQMVFEETVQTMHGMNIRTTGARLAVVLSKADLIRPQIMAAEVGTSDSIRAWLQGPLEQGNLIRAMDHEFASGRYFLTAAPLAGTTADLSIESFAAWLLNGEGMTV
ncbi:hypothetical protein [Actinoplanes sp. NPDC051411]|uniref:TRAFAC clade GTPase domain-containing protein n=1 Tax=Actinoplanes sp. NPDC051411 TaxID=3155522 RepID=UPI00343A7E62